MVDPITTPPSVPASPAAATAVADTQIAAGAQAVSSGTPSLTSSFDLNTSFAQDTTPLVAVATSNPNYVLRLYELSGSLSVMVECPRQFRIQMTNKYVDVLSLLRGIAGDIGKIAAALPGGSVGGALSNIGSSVASLGTSALALTGTQLMPRPLSVQVWQNSPPIEFSLPLIFNAINNETFEVTDQIKTLVQMAAPYRSTGGLLGTAGLHGPSPSFLEVVQANGDLTQLPNLLCLRLGKSISLPGLIITSLEIDWENRFTVRGLPIGATATVGLAGFWSFARDELLAAFL